MKTLLLSLAIICSTMVFSQINLENYLHKRDSLVQVNIGKQYPEFTATDLNEINITEKKLPGRITIINFWFRYCEPCVAEFNELNTLYEKFKVNPVFQFISFTSDSQEEARESVNTYQLYYPVCPISEQECFRLNFNQGFPTTIIVDQLGKIKFMKFGGSLEKDKIAIDIQKLSGILEQLLSK